MSPFVLRWSTRVLVAACSLKAVAGVALGDGHVLFRVVSACMVVGVVAAVTAAKHGPALIFAALGSMYASTPLGIHEPHFWMWVPGLLCFVAIDTPRPTARFRRTLRAAGYFGLTVATLALIDTHGFAKDTIEWGMFSAALVLPVGIIAVATIAVRSTMDASVLAVSIGLGPWLLLALVTLLTGWVPLDLATRNVFVGWLCAAPIGFAILTPRRITYDT